MPQPSLRISQGLELRMTTEGSNQIPSDYRLLITFRHFERVWIYEKYFLLQPTNVFEDWPTLKRWSQHSLNLREWLRRGWPTAKPTRKLDHENKMVEVYGDDLVLCSECGDYFSVGETPSTQSWFSAGNELNFRSARSLCIQLSTDYQTARPFQAKPSPLGVSAASLIRNFATSRLNVPQFILRQCGEPVCKGRTLRTIKEFEAAQRELKNEVDPEVASWIAEKKKPQKPPRTYDNFVYLVHASGHWKLGVSQNVEQRLRELQTGCPFRVEIVKFWKSEHATKVERALHRRFAEHRMEGEWFKLPENSVTYLKGIDDLDREFIAETS